MDDEQREAGRAAGREFAQRIIEEQKRKQQRESQPAVETHRRKKVSNLSGLIVLVVVGLLVFAIFRNSKTPGYHHRDGYIDRNGKFHKPTVVRDKKH